MLLYETMEIFAYAPELGVSLCICVRRCVAKVVAVCVYEPFANNNKAELMFLENITDIFKEFLFSSVFSTQSN